MKLTKTRQKAVFFSILFLILIFENSMILIKPIFASISSSTSFDFFATYNYNCFSFLYNETEYSRNQIEEIVEIANQSGLTEGDLFNFTLIFHPVELDKYNVSIKFVLMNETFYGACRYKSDTYEFYRSENQTGILFPLFLSENILDAKSSIPFVQYSQIERITVDPEKHVDSPSWIVSTKYNTPGYWMYRVRVYRNLEDPNPMGDFEYELKSNLCMYSSTIYWNFPLFLQEIIPELDSFITNPTIYLYSTNMTFGDKGYYNPPSDSNWGIILFIIFIIGFPVGITFILIKKKRKSHKGSIKKR